jgi:hypothetical protein
MWGVFLLSGLMGPSGTSIKGKCGNALFLCQNTKNNLRYQYNQRKSLIQIIRKGDKLKLSFYLYYGVTNDWAFYQNFSYCG